MKSREDDTTEFFPAIKSYVTVPKIPMFIILVKYCAYLNKKYLTSDNFPHLLIKVRYMKNDVFFKI